MPSEAVIFYKLVAMSLLIFVGFIARRMKLLPENSFTVLSHYILSIATPFYVMVYMSRTVSRDSILNYWHFPLLAFLLLALSDLISILAAYSLSRPATRPTYRFLAAIPNWMFFPLVICEPLFGMDGVRVVLLFNLGITLYVWSFGMTWFHPGFGWGALRDLILNRQIIATALGILIALFIPQLRDLHNLGVAELTSLPLHLGLLASVWEAVTLVGGTCLSISIFQIGVRLAANDRNEPASLPISRRLSPASVRANAKLRKGEWAGYRQLVSASLVRLVVTPLLIILVLILLRRLGLNLTPSEYLVTLIVFSQSPAVAGLSVADVFGGDSLLAARAIVWMTLASLVTVPLMFILTRGIMLENWLG
ncbi:MAG: AEC family transporter [Planctomycetota bacterium]|jgi:predicted permease|nr:AEC family transporter [Planctomycetota bacterium]